MLGVPHIKSFRCPVDQTSSSSSSISLLLSPSPLSVMPAFPFVIPAVPGRNLLHHGHARPHHRNGDGMLGRRDGSERPSSFPPRDRKSIIPGFHRVSKSFHEFYKTCYLVQSRIGLVICLITNEEAFRDRQGIFIIHAGRPGDEDG
jgi:hypothetical protein